MRDMEESVAAPLCYNKDLSPITKGKRTKRYRPHSPIPFTTTIAGEYNTVATTNHRLSPTVSTTSSEESTTTEEEDTARCLILLANSHFEHKKRHLEAGTAAAGGGAGGTCMYVCRTCDRAFSSFQALGGHRASHKKLKHEKYNISDVNIIADNMLRMEPLPLPRMHECSYCGAEFTSGQALGGHMRRHRAAPISLPSDQVSIEEPEPEESKKPRNGLCLDLNLPAQEVDHLRFGFNSRRQKSQEKLALSAAAAK